MVASTAARPAEAMANDVTSGGASLDGEPPALAWLSMSLGFPMGQAPLGPVGLRSKALRRALPPDGVFGHGDGRIPAADALCRAPFEGSARLATIAASSKGRRFHRARAPSVDARAPSACFRMVVKGASRQRLQSPRSTSTTGISRAPSPRAGGCPHSTFPRVTAPLSGYGQPSFLGIRGSIGLSPDEHPPDAIARAEVGYPDPRDPDTFCREPVTSRLERPTAPGVRSAHRLRAHPANLLARDPPLGLLLARDLPAGPLPALLREEDRARLRPRCLPS
jgi:hypothetical protein